MRDKKEDECDMSSEGFSNKDFFSPRKKQNSDSFYFKVNGLSKQKITTISPYQSCVYSVRLGKG